MGCAHLCRCSRGPRLRGHVDHDEWLERVPFGCNDCRSGLRVRRPGIAPVLQRDLLGWRGVDAAGVSPHSPLGRVRRSTRAGLAGFRFVHANAGWRSGSRLPLCLRRLCLCTRALAIGRRDPSGSQVVSDCLGCYCRLPGPAGLEALGRETWSRDWDRLVAHRRETRRPRLDRGRTCFLGPMAKKRPALGGTSSPVGTGRGMRDGDDLGSSPVRPEFGVHCAQS